MIFGRGKKKKEEAKKLAAYPIRRDMASEEIKLSIAKIANKHKIHAALSNPMMIPSLELENRKKGFNILMEFLGTVKAEMDEFLKQKKSRKYFTKHLMGTLESIKNWVAVNPEPDLDQMKIHFSKGPGDVEREVESIYD